VAGGLISRQTLELVRGPGLLLLDEPASALDEVHRSRLASVLAELDATMLVTSHDPAWWAALNWHRRIDLTAIADGA